MAKYITKNKEVQKIKIYDDSLTFEENFDDLTDVKYALLPIYKTPSNEEIDFSPLLNAGGKVITSKDFESHDLEYYIVDYDSIFGLRLLSYQRYNSHFFDCQERVFFEALLIKQKSFKYKPFYYSCSEIFKELGIKKDKVYSIQKKFIELGIISTSKKTGIVNNKPAQITYYTINAIRILALVPEIYIEDYQEKAIENLTIYLKPLLRQK